MKSSAITAALLVSLMLMGACATKRGALTGVGVGAGAVALGGLVVVAGGSSGEQHFGDSEADLVGAGLVVTGGVYLVGALFNLGILAAWGFVWETEPQPTQDEPFPLLDPPNPDATLRRWRDDAWVITKQARAAARDGDCEAVKRLDAQVVTYDPDFHESVFITDVAIKRCLEPTPTTQDSALKAAATAARAGDCDTVKKLDAQVIALDAEFHKTVFVVDIGIKRCLASAMPTPSAMDRVQP